MSRDSTNPSSLLSRCVKAIGPGLIIACVVIGPGSITTSSKVGAQEGYSRAWVIVVAVFFMMIYTTLAARLGVVSQTSTSELIARHAGRPLAVVIGLAAFFITAAYQVANNVGVHAALYDYLPFDYWVVVFNALALTFVLGFRNLYKFIERLMASLVGVMLLAFAVNLVFAQPQLQELAAGLNPFAGSSEISVSLLGLVGTTFVVAAAFYQSYLVRLKGWKIDDLRYGMIDARVSALIMALITLMIMTSAAASLRGHQLADLRDVAQQLRPLFGETGRLIFSIGVFAAAFSSFLVNSMIGGFIFSDALNLGDSPRDRWPRIFTAMVLLIGMVMALVVIRTGAKPVASIVMAQAVTVIASPLMAAALLWLTNLPSVMGDYRNGWFLNLSAGLGLALLSAMSGYTATAKVWPVVSQLIGLAPSNATP